MLSNASSFLVFAFLIFVRRLAEVYELLVGYDDFLLSMEGKSCVWDSSSEEDEDHAVIMFIRLWIRGPLFLLGRVIVMPISSIFLLLYTLVLRSVLRLFIFFFSLLLLQLLVF